MASRTEYVGASCAELFRCYCVPGSHGDGSGVDDEQGSALSASRSLITGYVRDEPVGDSVPVDPDVPAGAGKDPILHRLKW